jgi:DNA polymerase III subunit gamma/tau
MHYVVLARKYRPRRFDDMVGQEHVVRALRNALANGRLHHAYLFTGTRGIGKTTVSRILAKSLNCTGPDGSGGITADPCGVCSACTEIDADRFIDYIELDAASNRGIDEVRDLIERAAYKPSVARFKVFMIDEVHMLTRESFNALLKTLEEPPEYLKFVLATTDPEKVLPTVLSRCLQFNLRPMAPETVREHLARVLDAEQVPHDEGALRLLARAARGSMRDGLSLADQAIAYGGGRLDEAGVRAMLGSVDRSHAGALVEALARRDGAALLAEVDTLRGRGLSAAGTLEELATLLQQMAVEQAVPGALDPADPDHADAVRLAPALAADETQLLYSIALHGREELALMSDEYGALTMVLLRLLAFPPADGAPAKPARAQPLRAPAPPAMTLLLAPTKAAPPKPAPPAPPQRAAEPVAPAFAPAPPAPAPAPPADRALGDRWQRIVTALAGRGAVTALVRELALQAGLVAIDGARWTLVVERESLRAPALADRLAAALAAELGAAVTLDVQPGAPEDTPARRDAAERARRQAEAERTIHDDPVVQTLMSQFKSARIVPGSIKPI